MKKSEYNVLMKLVDFWEAIAERIEDQPVDMTANTHRQVADELRMVLMHMEPKPTLLSRIRGLFR